MDQSPPDTYNITIESNGKLVWNPNADIELDVYSITVNGEMHIGGENCLYEKYTTITFNGKTIILRKENNLAQNKQKQKHKTNKKRTNKQKQKTYKKNQKQAKTKNTPTKYNKQNR
jgi:hypothetical protein